MKNNKGFSFVELLVAVAILGIISLPIASSFALAAKTDAKAVHLSAMNDAADDVMLLIGEIEDGYIVSDSAFEINPETRDKRLNEIVLSFALFEVIETDFETAPLQYTFRYNHYEVELTFRALDEQFYRIDITVTHSIAGSPLEVHRKGLLKYA